MKESQEVLKTWFHRVWTEEDQSAIDDIFPATGEARGLGAQSLVGPEDFKQFQSALCALVSDIHISIDKCIEEDGWTCALCTFSAVSRSDGSQITITGTVFGRIAGGKILEAYNHFDFLGLWCQLGYLPPNSFEKGLQGEKIA